MILPCSPLSHIDDVRAIADADPAAYGSAENDATTAISFKVVRPMLPGFALPASMLHDANVFQSATIASALMQLTYPVKEGGAGMSFKKVRRERGRRYETATMHCPLRAAVCCRYRR